MQLDDAVVGTCDGTGAAINVCLGFVPRRVELFNLEAATLHAVEWSSHHALVTAIAEGVKITGTSTTTRAALTAGNGVKAYNGGDEIIYDGVTDNRWEVPAGTSAEEVYVDGSYQRSATGDAPYRCYGNKVSPTKVHGVKVKTSPGFTIAAGLAADGEQLAWIAYR